MSDDPIYNLNLGQRAHRLLWWLLANQAYEKGIPTGVVTGLWRDRASKELKLPRNGIWKAQTELRDAGVVEFKPYDQTIKINGKAFDKK